MASFTQQLILELAVRDKNLQSQLRRVGDDAAKAGEKMEEFQEQTRTALEIVGQTGLAIGVGKFLKGSIQAYGELINVQQTAKQVFGETYRVIEEFSKGAVEAVGLSERAAIEATTYIAGLGKAAGVTGPELAAFSEDIVRLGADLAAAFNTDVAQAIGAIQSGFSGSSVEPLRRYNIVINDTALKQEYLALTGERVTAVLTQQQRAAAFISLLYKNSADYIGQWDRESNQFLGTQQRLSSELENFRATIGSALEPAITGVSNAIIKLLQGYQVLDDATDGFITGFTAISLAALAAVPAFNALSTAVRLLAPGLASVATTFRTAGLAAGVGALGAAAGPAAILLGGLAVVGGIYTAVARKAAKEQREFNDGLAEFNSLDLDAQINTLQKGFNFVTPEQIERIETLRETAARTGDEVSHQMAVMQQAHADFQIEDNIEGFRKLAEQNLLGATAILQEAQASKELRDELQLQGLTVGQMTGIVRKQAEANEENAEAANSAQKYIDLLTGATSESADEIEVATEAYDEFSDGLKGIAERADEAKKAVRELVDQLAEGSERQNDALQTQLAAEEAIAEWINLAFSDLEEGETARQRQLAVLEQEDAAYAAINDRVASIVQAEEDRQGAALEGRDLIEAQRDALEQVRSEFEAIPAVTAEIDRQIALLDGRDLEVALDVLDNATPTVEAFIQQFANRDVAMDLLVDYAGLTPEEAVAALEPLDDEQIVSIVAEAVTDAAEADIEGLEDADYIAQVTAEALLDTAKTDMDAFVYDTYTSDVHVDADLSEADRKVQNWIELERSATIRVDVDRVVTERNVGTGGGGGGDDSQGEQRGLLRPAVVAGQPVVHNTYVTVPTADPSAVIGAVQKWSRRNGALPIMRGRG